MKIGLSAYFLPNDPIESAMEKLAETGAKYVEIIWDLPHFSPENKKNYDLKKLKDTIDSYNLGISVHAPFFDLNSGSIYREMRKFSVNQFKNCIEFCSMIGADLMVIHPGYSPLLKYEKLYQEARNRFIEALREVGDYAFLRGVKLSIENISAAYFFAYELDDLVTLAGKIKNLGITLDIGHAFITKIERKRPFPEEEIGHEIVEKLKPFLTHIHFHDNGGVKDEHLAIGKGKINFSPIVAAIKKINFMGRIIIEAWEPEQSLDLAKDQLKTVKNLFGQ